MDKTRISLTIDPDVLSSIDTEAQAAGVSRSAWLERVGREAAVRARFERFNPAGDAEEFPEEMTERVRAVRTFWNGPEAR